LRRSQLLSCFTPLIAFAPGTNPGARSEFHSILVTVS
jgi:hypothetical protein